MCKLSGKNFNAERIHFLCKIVPGDLWQLRLLSFDVELASSAKDERLVFDSAVRDQQVKRGEMIIDGIFNAAVRLNKVAGRIQSVNQGETQV